MFNIKYILIATVAVWSCGFILPASPSRACTTPQYVGLDQRGIIECSFISDMYSIYWYDTTDSATTPPIARREKSVTTIDENGDYGLYQNGSLIITRVAFNHEKTFRVLYSTSEFGGTVTEDIQLVVTVQPAIGYPLINKCGDERICFAQLSDDDTVFCSVDNIKPAMELKWFEKKKSMKSELKYNETINERFPLFNSKVTLNDIDFSGSLLQLLVCKSEDNLSLLTEKESVILLENLDSIISKIQIKRESVEIGSEVILPCENGDNVESLIWKTTNEKGNMTMIARVIDKYFILDDAIDHLEDSLVIPAAKVTDSGFYFCVSSNGTEESILTYDLYVYVKPTILFPIIHLCGNERSCHAYLDEGYLLVCYVERTRPVVELKWILRGSENIPLIQMYYNTNSQDLYYTSFVNVTVPANNNYAMILICAPENDENNLIFDESAILIESTKPVVFNNTDTTVRWIGVNTELKLPCTDRNVDYTIWKRMTVGTTTFEDILYILYTDREISNSRFETNDENSLMLSSVTVEDEGTYICIQGYKGKETVTSHDVNVYVNPNPEYLVVDGCENQQYCVLTKGTTGNISCTIFDVRPTVNLEWKTFRDSSTNQISFEDREITKTQTGNTFTVILKSTFRVKVDNLEKATLECRTTEPSEYSFDLTTTFDILFKEKEQGTDETGYLIFLIPILVVLFILFSVLIVFCIKRRRNNNLQAKKPYEWEIEPLNRLRPPHSPIPDSYNIKWPTPDSPDGPVPSISEQDQLELFVKELRYKYEGWCAQIQPIPTFGKDLQYKVGDIFVDRAINVSNDGKLSEKWSRLESYKDIFTYPARRIIVEGDPGYGKSTMILQAAKDWYTKDNESSLKDVKIFILLRLKMLQGIPSIYNAIKDTLLPTDTRLSVRDIERLLRVHCNSVVIALDDFDEYPDKNKDSDFTNILKGNMLQDCKVILLTRMANLPEESHPTTLFMQLNGFSDKSKRQYIEKVSGSSEGISLKELVQGIPIGTVINDILKVPMFFTMMYHINSYIENRKEKEQLTTVTALFRYFMSIFQNRLKLKFMNKYESINKSETLKLGKVALNGLIEHNEGKVWQRQQIIKEIGQSSFDKFIKVGILVEERGTDNLLDSDTHGRKLEKVKFYHNLFCQWYAGVYLAESLQGWSPFNRSSLKKLNPFDLQYLYLFTCGLKEKAAERVIKYLKSGLYGDEFALLCTLEKTGDVNTIKETVAEICNETISFYEPSSRLLRNSSVLLLEIASTERIPIKCILIDRCYALVRDHIDHLGMKSGMSIPPLKTLEELIIYGVGRRLTVEETANIFLYVSKCEKLKKLSLQKTFQPYKIDDETVWNELQEKDTKLAVQIEWSPFNDRTYIVDIASGQWKLKTDDAFLTEDDYDKESEKFGAKDGT